MSSQSVSNSEGHITANEYGVEKEKTFFESYTASSEPCRRYFYAQFSTYHNNYAEMSKLSVIL
jgi:hypothetical protein